MCVSFIFSGGSLFDSALFPLITCSFNSLKRKKMLFEWSINENKYIYIQCVWQIVPVTDEDGDHRLGPESWPLWTRNKSVNTVSLMMWFPGCWVTAEGEVPGSWHYLNLCRHVGSPASRFLTLLSCVFLLPRHKSQHFLMSGITKQYFKHVDGNPGR